MNKRKSSIDAAPPERWGFDDGTARGPVIGMHAENSALGTEVPKHQHAHGQLVVALKGAVTCETDHSVWVVPPNCGVWIPGDLPHSIRATPNAVACYLFVAPGPHNMPDACCTIALSPLVRELVLYMADASSTYVLDSPIGRKAVVLIEELAAMPVEGLYLPTSADPRIGRLTKHLTAHPDDRRTLESWSKELAISERALTRLMLRETGLTFGRWRQQLHLLIAMQRLASGATVQRVAGDLGYDSVNAFITMFKKLVGKPPARYFSDLPSR